MKTRLYNARIITMLGDDRIIEGDIHIDGNKITYVGPAKPGTFDEEIDCEGNVLLPGFKNAHTHSGMTAFRSLADDLNLQDWLFNEIFPREDKMTGEDIFWLSKLAFLEYLTSGITACADMYLTPETIAEAAEQFGMRCQMVSGFNKFSGPIDIVEKRFNELNGRNPLTGFLMGLHAEYTCDKSTLEAMSELLHKYKAPLYVHMSETKTEHEECKGRYNLTPMALFDELGLWDFGGTIYHGVWVEDADMDIMKKRGIRVVSNPGSNTKLASGIAPITKYMQKGIEISLGTDGPSSNNCLDFFREMFLVTGLAKLRDNDPKAVDAYEVLKMACVNGAHAMGLFDNDALAEGKLADIIMIDMHQPNMQPILNIKKNIVYSGSKSNIKMTMIDGRILYRDGRFIGTDAEEVYEKCNEITARLKDI